ncbi:MAG TPA: DNA polymerase IV, partial [Solirubrobacteraceae bacterium]|nr:DNA polymerase IV [Solirubrobacteraceae bacterium]
DAAALDEALAGLAEKLARRMGRSGREGRTVVLRLRFGDYTRATRSRTLARATASSDELLAAARAMLGGAMPAIETRGITLVGLTVTNLVAPGGGEQLTLGLDLDDDGSAGVVL